VKIYKKDHPFSLLKRITHGDLQLLYGDWSGVIEYCRRIVDQLTLEGNRVDGKLDLVNTLWTDSEGIQEQVFITIWTATSMDIFNPYSSVWEWLVYTKLDEGTKAKIGFGDGFKKLRTPQQS
jgi:hypothetical protein